MRIYQFLTYIFDLSITAQVALIFYLLVLHFFPVFWLYFPKDISGEAKWRVIFNLLSIHQSYECDIGYILPWDSFSTSPTSLMSENTSSSSTTSKSSIFSVILIYFLNIESRPLTRCHMWRKITVDFVPEGSKGLFIFQRDQDLWKFQANACLGLCQELWLEFRNYNENIPLIGVYVMFLASIVSDICWNKLLIKLIPPQVNLLLSTV